MPQFFVSVAYVRDPKVWLKFTTTRGKIYNVNWSYTKILGLRYILHREGEHWYIFKNLKHYVSLLCLFSSE